MLSPPAKHLCIGSPLLRTAFEISSVITDSGVTCPCFPRGAELGFDLRQPDSRNRSELHVRIWSQTALNLNLSSAQHLPDKLLDSFKAQCSLSNGDDESVFKVLNAIVGTNQRSASAVIIIVVRWW